MSDKAVPVHPSDEQILAGCRELAASSAGDSAYTSGGRALVRAIYRAMMAAPKGVPAAPVEAELPGDHELVRRIVHTAVPLLMRRERQDNDPASNRTKKRPMATTVKTTPEWVDPRPDPLDVLKPVCGLKIAREVLAALDIAGFTIDPPRLSPTQRRQRNLAGKKQLEEVEA